MINDKGALQRDDALLQDMEGQCCLERPERINSLIPYEAPGSFGGTASLGDAHTGVVVVVAAASAMTAAV